MGLYYRIEEENGTILLVPSCMAIFATEKNSKGQVVFYCPGDNKMSVVKRVHVLTEDDVKSSSSIQDIVAQAGDAS